MNLFRMEPITISLVILSYAIGDLFSTPLICILPPPELIVKTKLYHFFLHILSLNITSPSRANFIDLLLIETLQFPDF